jgi:hypothetical protein
MSEWKARPQRNSDTTSFRPTIFDPSRSDDILAMDELFATASAPLVHDTLADQLLELVASLYPKEPATTEKLAHLVCEHLSGCDPSEYGRWVHYPWSNRLVHVLPPAEYVALRSDRNRYKITPEEQACLRQRTIGIVGLSVGQAVVLTMAMEGVGGRFRLADFDTLSLSNMNRLRTSVCNLGLAKTVVTAREMFEIDPFLDITVFGDGINDANADDFLEGDGRLDLLVEECDDLYWKVALRERAKALGVPVLMATSDQGLLDVERTPLDGDRCLPRRGEGNDLHMATARFRSHTRRLGGDRYCPTNFARRAPHLWALLRRPQTSRPR